MSFVKYFVLTTIISTVPLIFSYADHLTILDGPVPEELTIEYNGLKWAWASPCAGACGEPPINPSVQEGWRFCTEEEFSDIPPVEEFVDSDGNAICAAAYFDNHFQFCDLLDLNSGNLTNVPDGSFDDILLCMELELSGDEDADGVPDQEDRCLGTSIDEIADFDGCSVNQLCPCEGILNTEDVWKNHGKYVSCVSKTSNSFVEQGLITETEKDEIVSSTAQSECGR